MSVQVPTAEQAPRERPPRRSPSKWPLLAIGVLVGVTAVAALVSGEDDDDVTGEVLPVLDPIPPLTDWTLLHFPGEGSFVDVASGDAGSVAIAHIGNAWPSGAGTPMVWANVAGEAEWRTVELEDAARALPVSVAIDGGTVVVVGAIVDEAPTATVWSGMLGEPLRIVDRPLSSPGRLDLVRILDGRMVLVAHLSSTDPPTVLLTGSPGDWTDITPPGSGVQVNEILSTGDEWVAVGGVEGRATSWHSTDRGASWVQIRSDIQPGTVIGDAAVRGTELYAVVRTPADHSRVVRYRDGVWVPVGEPGSRSISWIAEVGGDLVGGQGAYDTERPHVPYLWRLLSSDRWAVASMPQPEAVTGGWPTVFAAAGADIVVGSSLGQPAVWQASASPSVVALDVPDASRRWERLAPLPGQSGVVAADDDLLVSLVWPDRASAGAAVRADGPTVYTSEDGVTWDSLPLPESWTFSGLRRVGGRTVVVGTTADFDVAVGILEGDHVVPLAETPGRLAGFDVLDDEIVLYVRLASTTSRVTVPLDRDSPTTVTPLSWNVVDVMTLGDGLVVARESGSGSWPPGALRVSVDGGNEWTEFDIASWWVLRIGEDVVVLEGDPPHTPHRLVFGDTVGLEPVVLPDVFAESFGSRQLFDWAGGIAIHQPGGEMLWLPALGAEPVSIDLSPATGFNGAFLWPTDRHVMASEGGELVLYRWLGPSDG